MDDACRIGFGEANAKCRWGDELAGSASRRDRVQGSDVHHRTELGQQRREAALDAGEGAMKQHEGRTVAVALEDRSSGPTLT